MDLYIKSVGYSTIFFTFIGLFSSIILFIKLQDERNYWKYFKGDLNPFKKKKSIMNPNEKKLYENLLELPIMKDYLAFGQVPYSEILEVQTKYRDLKMRFEVINELRSDFVILDKITFDTKLIIELNDGTHFWMDRKSRDKIIESALESCGINYLTVETKDISQKDKLNNLIASKLS